MSPDLLDHFVEHILGHCDHAVLHPHAVDGVLGLARVVLEQLQTAVVVEKLHHAELIASHAF